MDLSRVLNSGPCPTKPLHSQVPLSGEYNEVCRSDKKASAPLTPRKRSRSTERSDIGQLGGCVDTKRVMSEGRVTRGASSASTKLPYGDLLKSVRKALERTENGLSTCEKVTLALEVLRARQLELDLTQARHNIEALANRDGCTPKSFRSIIPATMVKGLPVGVPIIIKRGTFLLAPAPDDPETLFLMLDLQSFGNNSMESNDANQSVLVPGASCVKCNSNPGEGAHLPGSS